MNWKFFISWLPGIPIAIINGSIRQYFFMLHFDEHSANQFSVVSFILLFGIYVWYIIRWLKPNSTRMTFHVGLTWLIYTMLFEFIFGHFVLKHSWEKLLFEYNILEGRLWVMVLLWIVICPMLIYKYKNRKR